MAELDDPLAGIVEVAGQARPVSSGSLDRPGPLLRRGVPVCPLEELDIAAAAGRERRRGHLRGGGGLHHRGSDAVAVGIDADHMCWCICWHGGSPMLL